MSLHYKIAIGAGIVLVLLVLWRWYKGTRRPKV